MRSESLLQILLSYPIATIATAEILNLSLTWPDRFFLFFFVFSAPQRKTEKVVWLK